jgi:large subunit ribosomal protein L4e
METKKVNVYSWNEGVSIDNITLPDIFLFPMRIDILKFVHLNMAKNKRQPFSVNQAAGMNTSSKSWGTGRAVSRVPRVPGSGTHRSGQGAVTNMCRGGRMFAPTTTWRKWHHKINTHQRRQAIFTAIASSGIASLIIARGHDIKEIPEIPLVIESSVESLVRTEDGKKAIKSIGGNPFLIQKKKILRPGKGKMRNRRLKKNLGPLIIFQKNARCFRNIPEIQTCCIDSLNILKLAPGGHVGRLCIWTYTAFVQLNTISSLYFYNNNFYYNYICPTNINIKRKYLISKEN